MFQSLEKALSPLNSLHGAGTWLLRIAFAAVYIPKGLEKFMNLQGFAGMMELAVGVALLVALAELLGGLAVLVGGFLGDAANDVLTRIGALVTLPVILGAIFMVHLGQWSFVPSETHPMGGMEFQVVLLLLGLYLLIRGRHV